MVEQKTMNVGVIGAGRMGHIHSKNLSYYAPNANLVAVTDVDANLLDKLMQQLPGSVSKYQNIDDFFKHTGLNAVFIACATSAHAPMILRSIEQGLHIFCEKPISHDLQESIRIYEEAKKHPDLKIMMGFSRRFDDSYMKAYKSLGEIGDVYMVRSAHFEKYGPNMRDFLYQYSAKSGGIYADVAIHDIDMTRWMLSVKGKPKVKKVYTQGWTQLFTELNDHNDSDNAFGVVEFSDNRFSTFQLSRTSNLGYQCETEIHGSKGTLVVGKEADANKVSILDQHGTRKEPNQDFFERFKNAFVNEANSFVSSCIDNTEPLITLEDGLEAYKIVVGLNMSFKLGVPVEFDHTGFPVGLKN